MHCCLYSALFRFLRYLDFLDGARAMYGWRSENCYEPISMRKEKGAKTMGEIDREKDGKAESLLTNFCETFVKYFEKHPEAKEEFAEMFASGFVDFSAPEFDDCKRFTVKED